jgi:hypothetical protein
MDPSTFGSTEDPSEHKVYLALLQYTCDPVTDKESLSLIHSWTVPAVSSRGVTLCTEVSSGLGMGANPCAPAISDK